MAAFFAVALVVAVLSVWLFLAETTNGDGGIFTGDSSVVASAERSVAVGSGIAVSGEGHVTAGPGGVAVGSVVLASASEPAEPLPPPHVDLCVGRDAEVAQVASVLVSGGVVAVVGGPGIGKSTVLGAATADPATRKRYGQRRFVVSCDGAMSAEALVDKVARVVGVAPGEHLANRVLALLHERPSLLVLDNFETVVDADQQGVGELIGRLRDPSSEVALGLGYRGASCPVRPAGMVEVPVGPLTPGPATEVFVSAAGGRHQADPHLAGLVRALDGLPLALVLLGGLAHSQTSLEVLAKAWEAKRSDLLARGTRPDRASSLPVSIELSWDRLSADGKAALSLAALLPDGWPAGRYDTYVPESLASGVVELGTLSLIHHDDREEGARHRCLAPIRDHVLAHHPPEDSFLDPLLERVGRLARTSEKVGRDGGAKVVAQITPEHTNLVSVIRTCLTRRLDITRFVPDILEFQRFTGLGDDLVGEDALAAAKSDGTRAEISQSLGSLHLDRGNHDRARALFDDALPLFRQIGDVLGEANTLRLLGRIEDRESNNDQARTLFDRALPLYRQTGDALGEANTLSCLGQIELIESNNDQARTLFDQALPLYRQTGAMLGEANSLRNLGRVELSESNNNQARALFNQALPLYRQTGDALGEANTLRLLGEVEYRESNNDQARALFDQALPLYERIRAVYSQAFTHAWLARVTDGARRDAHCAQVDELAQRLNQPDLHMTLREIGGCGGSPPGTSP